MASQLEKGLFFALHIFIHINAIAIYFLVCPHTFTWMTHWMKPSTRKIVCHDLAKLLFSFLSFACGAAGTPCYRMAFPVRCRGLMVLALDWNAKGLWFKSQLQILLLVDSFSREFSKKKRKKQRNQMLWQILLIEDKENKDKWIWLGVWTCGAN